MGLTDRLRKVVGRYLPRSTTDFDVTRVLLGQVLSELHATSRKLSFQDHEFRVYSQWGEDGIIQHLTRHVELPNRTFVEFGVEDFREANCRFLMEKDGWRGFVMDGSAGNIERLRSEPLYWRHDLTAVQAFVDRENVHQLLQRSGFDRDLGILSVDIDGMDYHVLTALDQWSPRITIVEYNALFGAERAVAVPYDPAFSRFSAHHSGLYAGASLPAFVELLAGRGSSLVGVNRAGNNAFFVRDDLLSDALPATKVGHVFRESTFRESRDEDGQLTFVSGARRLDLIAHLPLVDVTTDEELLVGDLHARR